MADFCDSRNEPSLAIKRVEFVLLDEDQLASQEGL